MSQALSARRCFRLGAVTALALVVGYASPMPLPYFAPLFAWLLAATPAPPIGPRFLVGLVVVAVLGLSVGRLLAPMLMQFPVTAFLLAALGLYFSFYITLNLGKAVLGVFLTMGLMLISVTGILSLPLADAMIDSLAWGLVIAVLAQWLVYPWFPESDPFPPPVAPPGAAQSNWVALRGTLITLPVFWVALAYPATYIPVMMKAVTLAQQTSRVSARRAGLELIGSTFLGGCVAVVFWLILSIHPNLWVFGMTMLLFGVWIAARMYGVFPSRFSPSFWNNVALTMIILIGPAVQDTASGQDVYQAFAMRMGLFLAVTLYAWAALAFTEWWRARLALRAQPSPSV